MYERGVISEFWKPSSLLLKDAAYSPRAKLHKYFESQNLKIQECEGDIVRKQRRSRWIEPFFPSEASRKDLHDSVVKSPFSTAWKYVYGGLPPPRLVVLCRIARAGYFFISGGPGPIRTLDTTWRLKGKLGRCLFACECPNS